MYDSSNTLFVVMQHEKIYRHMWYSRLCNSNWRSLSRTKYCNQLLISTGILQNQISLIY